MRLFLYLKVRVTILMVNFFIEVGLRLLKFTTDIDISLHVFLFIVKQAIRYLFLDPTSRVPHGVEKGGGSRKGHLSLQKLLVASFAKLKK